MELLIIIGAVLALLALLVSRINKSNTNVRRRPDSQAQPVIYDDNPYAAEDKRFYDAILKAVGSKIGKHFYTKLVGITYENEDGTVRENLIRTCKPFDPLEVIWEPNNTHDPNAIAIHKENGRMLGYLNSRTAEEVATSIKKHGTVWRACVKLAQPKSKYKHGCLVICLMEMKDERVEAKR